MKKTIENIFMDLYSYNLIRDSISLESLTQHIIANVTTDNPQPVDIAGQTFYVEFHPNHDYLSYTYTLANYYDIDYDHNNFKNSVYLCEISAYNKSYVERLPVETVLLYTNEPYITVRIYDDGDSFNKMDCSTGELTQIL